MKSLNAQKVRSLAKRQTGFTFIELVLVIGILGTLFGIGVLSLSNLQLFTTNSTDASVLISDIKSQQIKAMTGDTEGRGTPDNYGVKILPNQYILFHGNTYNPSDTSNYAIDISASQSLTSTFPNNEILFTQSSGEIAGFSNGQNTIILTTTSTGEKKTITLNKYGSVTDLQ